ncbi:MAG: YihY/virulence factor BrkB family protein [Acidimicrobiia bacterium]|nr:YihY/virulence factor BrkB family protein [Acidimicrobiia bacterium]
MSQFFSVFLGAIAAAVAIARLRPRAEPVLSEESPVDTEELTASRWFDEPLAVTKSVIGRLREHHMPMIAGSLSYYAFLALFPAAIAAVSIYGLVLDPADLTAQIEEISSALPEETAKFIEAQLTEVVDASGSGLGVTAVVSIIIALWSASAGTKALITGIDIAYETPENRPFIVLRGMAFAITIGLIVFITAAASAVTFLPDLMSEVGAGDETRRLIEIGRWPVIFVAVIVGLGLLYKIAPNRPAALSPWVSMGALAVAVLWLLATVGFSVYVNNLGSFNATYGALTGVIVLLLWFFMSGLIVLTGAELNAELEQRGLARHHQRALSSWR